MSDAIKAAEITSKNYTKITMISIAVTVLITIIPFIWDKLYTYHDREQEKLELLYSEIYFTNIKNEILLTWFTNIANDINIDFVNGDIKYNIDYYVKKLPVPYKILLQILDKNKRDNNLNNIPNSYVKKINSFLDIKLARDKVFLSEVNSAKALKNFLSSCGDLFVRYINEIKQNYSVSNAESNLKYELQMRIANEFNGLLMANLEYICGDLNKTYQYIINCEKEFNESIRNR